MSPIQVGQAAGTVAGGAIAPGVGSTLGALAGTLAGLVIEGEMDKVRQKREREELTEQLQAPSLPAGERAEAVPGLAGEPTRVWIDESLSDGRLIAGHFEQRYLP